MDIKMVSAEVDKIKVGERVRKDLGDITSLAESIKTEGLINPIIIDKDYNLRRGYRRLSAFRLMKEDKIPAFIVENSKNEVMNKIIDFIENVHRKELNWQEKSLFVTKIHNELKEKSKGKWTTDMTAAILHMSAGTVRELLNITKAPKEVLKKALEKGSSREAYRFINKEKHDKLVEMAVSKIDMSDAIETYNGNCLEEMDKLKDESVDIIYTDPPYGIDLTNMTSGGKALSFNESIYDEKDDFKKWYKSIDIFLGSANRVLKKGGWLLMWGAMTNITAIYELLEKNKFNRFKKPLTLCYSQGLTMNPKYNFGSSSDFLWVSYKGKDSRVPLVKQGLMDSIYTTKVPPSDREYTLEKPPEITEYWLPAFVVPGESVVLDAFAGVGSLLSPLFNLGVKKVIGIELNKDRYNKLNKNLKLAALGSQEGE